MGDMRVGAWATKRLQQKLIASKWANDPIQAAKGFAFDMYLGMFNPIQLLVQTAGIAIPMSMHPFESAMAFRNFVGLRTLFGMASVDDAVVAAKAMGYNPKEFKSMLMAFKSSGVADSILANSDFGYFASSRFGYYSPGLWENIKKSGRVFYNMGELNNRTFAWTLAYERLAKANKWNLSKARTSEEIVEISREAFRLGMNMTQANRSKSQTMGSTALMTQFWKVTMQFYENALTGLFSPLGAKKGGAWTFKESAAALLNSTFMLGAANFSIDELWTQYEGWLIDQFDLDTSDPKHREFIAFWRGGFLELMTFKAFDYEMDISDRIGVASGVNMIYENLRNLALVGANDEDANILKSIMGASYGIKTRTHTAIADVLDVFRVAGEVETVNFAQAEAVLRSMAGITSTGNNLLNAMLWKNANAIMVKGTGERLGDLPGSQVYIGKALGIDPLSIEKYYLVDKKSRKYDRLKADISKEVAQLARQLYLSGQYTEANERELVRMKMHLLVADLDAVDRETVLANALNILDEDTKTEKMILKMIDGLIASTTDEEAKEKHRDLQILKGLEND